MKIIARTLAILAAALVVVGVAFALNHSGSATASAQRDMPPEFAQAASTRQPELYGANRPRHSLHYGWVRHGGLRFDQLTGANKSVPAAAAVAVAVDGR